MVQYILVGLIILWLLGFIQLPFLNISLFTIAHRPFTLHSLLLFALLVFVISLLPGIFRTIAAILLVFWLLSILGIFAIGGLAHIILIIIILAVIFSFF